MVEMNHLPKRWLPWIRLAWVLLILTSLWTFAGTVSLTRQFSDALPARLEAGLQALGWDKEIFFWFSVATITPVFISFILVAAIIFWLRPHDRMALFTSVFLMSFGTANAFIPAKEYLLRVADAPRFYAIPSFLAGMLSFGLLGVFFAMFPDGRFVPKWMRWIALEGFLFSIAWNLFPGTVGDFSGPLGVFSLLAAFLMFGGSLVAQIWRYRHYATALQRQQTKWFVYGLSLVIGILIVPSILVYGLPVGDPKTSVLLDAFVSIANMAFILLPLSIGIAILRYRLWDIDLIIRKTLVYTAVTGLLALAYLGGVTLLQSSFQALSGQSSTAAIVVSTLGIAALFTPLRRRVQDFIDRRFYRQKYDTEQILAQFTTTARDEVELEKLADAVLEIVGETMHPERVLLWLRETTPDRAKPSTTTGPPEAMV